MMLQRAASNAYSWWWASHIRTKQSKWLEQNLQDMEEKVANTLKLIEEDGDSFAKRAEMYYKKRPELIYFVEESFRAYRALAERYDHISTELQNANNTIASVFPDQVQFEMDDDDDDIPRRTPENLKPNIPKVPKAPIKDLKSILSSGVKKLRSNKAGKKANAPAVSKSGLTKPGALEKIDKLQKDILALQTVKEFVKCSYEDRLAKYWEIEKQITELQVEVSTLQDEFGEGMVIEDDEARSLMAAAALKSCQETLQDLREKQRRSAEEAKKEQKRIKEAWQKFESLRKEVASDQQPGEAKQEHSQNVDISFEELNDMKEGEELKALEEKIKERFQVGQKASLTVTEMAEKIDELVNKVISLETAVSSQTAFIERLRTETDDLQSQIQILEDDKATLINGSDSVKTRMKEMEEKLSDVRDLNASVKAQNLNLQTHFTEADCNLEHLSEKVHFVKPDDEQEVASLPKKTEPLKKHKSGNSVKEPAVLKEPGVSGSTHKKESAEQREVPSPSADSTEVVNVNTQVSEHVVKPAAHIEETNPSPPNWKGGPNDFSDNSTEPQRQHEVKELSPSRTSNSSSQLAAQKQDRDPEEPNWQEMFMKGMENREKTLLAEYTATLRNFKEIKRKLVEVEKKNQDGTSDDSAVQLRELKSANATKDEEIRALCEKLSLLQTVVAEGKDAKEKNASSSQSETLETAAMKGHIEMVLVDQSCLTSEIEEKLRMDIDQLLEENLDFWLRFSAALHQIQKYETAVEDLRSELSKLEEKRKEEGSRSRAFSIKSDIKPIYKHLSEIQTELNVWMDKCVHLKDEQQKRFSSLCNIQEEITKALKTSAEEEDFRFTSYQAAKFQGEVLNMKQENNKVAQELQAGLDHIAVLQLEVDKTLARLNEEFGFAGPNPQNPQLPHSGSRNRVPLRSFIFGVKPKKHRSSIFTCMTPAMHRKYNGFRAAF
ncbi:protein NETWORKED 2D [Punica granatum]|uniref:NAB domain-containing protein n=2 Tax=Punica granatum TaxID=22663 RepID=A0A218XKV5_PUNGR|nr:protein NETWORKED 2D [Punica granatum]OWM85410.1 hypothetical protein CDL15_Pgr019034 [Punica granatum]PKI42114.1 hypothetical protein CRG98_037567 [Punica granatum]